MTTSRVPASTSTSVPRRRRALRGRISKKHLETHLASHADLFVPLETHLASHADLFVPLETPATPAGRRARGHPRATREMYRDVPPTPGGAAHPERAPQRFGGAAHALGAPAGVAARTHAPIGTTPIGVAPGMVPMAPMGGMGVAPMMLGRPGMAPMGAPGMPPMMMPGGPPMMPGGPPMMMPGGRPIPGQFRGMAINHPTGLSPDLLPMFAPRPPLKWYPAPPKPKKTQRLGGIASALGEFESVKKRTGRGSADDDDVGDDSRRKPSGVYVMVRKEVRKAARREANEQKAREAIKDAVDAYRPKDDPNATSDPYRTLFVARLAYDVDEAKVKREFEYYGRVC